MTIHKDWFGVDVKKRAAKVRSQALAPIIKELLSNGLDAGATTIAISCKRADRTRRDGDGLRAFEVTCTDNGAGCDDPEILRRVGSTTSDLHAEMRGRFGQGLIDAIAASICAVICTLGHRLAFNKDGCRITTIRNKVCGLSITLTLRHSGEGFDELDHYFRSVILPDGVTLTFNGMDVRQRVPERVIPGLKLPTDIYDPARDRVRRCQRITTVEVHPQHGASPMIYELGIPVDELPWQLPYDINVLQKTPLDTERNMLSDKYKGKLVSHLVPHMSEDYIAYMGEHDDAPAEIKNDRDNAASLSDDAKNTLVKTVTGVDPDRVVRRNPLDPDDTSESQELENKGFVPLNRGVLPNGVSEILEDAPTVAAKHDELCKVHFQNDPKFPPETERQRVCIAAYKIIADSLLGQSVRFDRFRSGSRVATWKDGVISLNIEVNYLWDDPLGAESVGTILHECAHRDVSGHSIAFAEAVQRLGGKLAGWVGKNPQRWAELRDRLYGNGRA